MKKQNGGKVIYVKVKGESNFFSLPQGLMSFPLVDIRDCNLLLRGLHIHTHTHG